MATASMLMRARETKRHPITSLRFSFGRRRRDLLLRSNDSACIPCAGSLRLGREAATNSQQRSLTLNKKSNMKTRYLLLVVCAAAVLGAYAAEPTAHSPVVALRFVL